jgi:hypothetical protein
LPDAAGPSMAITMVRKILQIGFKIYAKYRFLSIEEDVDAVCSWLFPRDKFLFNFGKKTHIMGHEETHALGD